MLSKTRSRLNGLLMQTSCVPQKGSAQHRIERIHLWPEFVFRHLKTTFRASDFQRIGSLEAGNVSHSPKTPKTTTVHRRMITVRTRVAPTFSRIFHAFSRSERALLSADGADSSRRVRRSFQIVISLLEIRSTAYV